MDELAKRFADLAEKYGPSVVDTALQAARVEAWHALVFNLFGIAAALVLFRVGRRLWTAKGNSRWEEHDLQVMAGGALLVIGGIIGFFAVMNTFDPWLWMTMKNPELWIAKKSLGL
jgi:hypothetical protein